MLQNSTSSLPSGEPVRIQHGSVKCAPLSTCEQALSAGLRHLHVCSNSHKAHRVPIAPQPKLARGGGQQRFSHKDGPALLHTPERLAVHQVPLRSRSGP